MARRASLKKIKPCGGSMSRQGTMGGANGTTSSRPLPDPRPADSHFQLAEEQANRQGCCGRGGWGEKRMEEREESARVWGD